MRSAGEATRARILAAAKEEFAEHGLAGARINRIAAQAQASKERLYAYFPSKESLFAAVSEQLVTEVAEQAKLTGDDVPGYVGRLFDNHVKHPENARLHDWLSLTPGDPAGGDDVSQALVSKLDEIRRGQQDGHIDPSWDPVDLFLLITDIAKSMAAPNEAAHRLLGSGRARSRAARRAAAVEAARRLVTPSTDR
jgi:AcrR family transcriptional regulator